MKYLSLLQCLLGAGVLNGDGIRFHVKFCTHSRHRRILHNAHAHGKHIFM